MATALTPLAAAFRRFVESTATNGGMRPDLPELALQAGG
jgi:hypothetical protein